jgi:hypothetical protein
MKRLKFKNLERAAVSAALFFGLSLSGTAFAKNIKDSKEQSGSSHSETYHDLIEKAYNLSLQKDRTQAVGLLIAGIKREGRRSPSSKELLQALEKVATVFYSDKAQQLYELGISLKTTDPTVALSKLQEADRLEPENLSITLELARISLSQNDCDAAATRMKKIKELGELLEEPKLVESQAQVCLGLMDDFRKNRSQVDLKKSVYAPFWQVTDIEASFKEGDFAKAKEVAMTLQSVDSHFPEAYYWDWKSSQELKLKADASAQKYLNNCKTLSARQIRDYSKEPALCRRTTEVETFLKKMNNSEI